MDKKINELELELIQLEDIFEEQKNNKILEGKVLGIRRALHILTGKSYDPADYAKEDNEE